MQIIKRNGGVEKFDFEKILKNIKNHCERNGCERVKVVSLCQGVQDKLFNFISTYEINELIASDAISMLTVQPDYGKLAASIIVENYHKSFEMDLVRLYKECYYAGAVSGEFFSIVENYGEFLGDLIDDSRDYKYDYFGLKTLERAYLLKINGKVVESPQRMLMRVTVGIFMDYFGSEDMNEEKMKDISETYYMLSNHFYTHASPTIFNSGTNTKQFASCFLLSMKDDSLPGIYESLADCAKISKIAGGIGINVSNIRAKGSKLVSSNGTSNGIVPMLRVFNESARYIDQGGKRKGGYCIYLEPWHADVFEFLELKKNHGDEHRRCRDLFFALWISDLFMERVETNMEWSLFCPNDVELYGFYGEEFKRRYLTYEMAGLARKRVKARDLWRNILTSQIETGGPFMLYKDACNEKNNQKNGGYISSSNLCTEIIQFHNVDKVAVCNLASISLTACVVEGKFSRAILERVVRRVVRNLNLISAKTEYATSCSGRDWDEWGPIGIGVQGLADVFQMLGMPFGGRESRELNVEIFEWLYYFAIEESMLIAKERGYAYKKFVGSPFSKGELQLDMWGVKGDEKWSVLREEVKAYGTANSVLTTIMPTASTAQILGNSENIEPVTNNLYVRRVIAGEYEIINKNLVRELIAEGLWNKVMLNEIVRARGSIQGILSIPKRLRDIYKTVWEIPQRTIIDMAVDRAPYIDQSQSLNVYMESPDYAKLSSMHFYGWRSGLKTGMYYLRTQPANNPIQFSLETCTSCSV